MDPQGSFGRDHLNVRSNFVENRPGYLDEFGANTVRVIDDIQLLSDTNPGYARLVQEGIRASLRAMLMFQGQPIGVPCVQ